MPHIDLLTSETPDMYIRANVNAYTIHARMHFRSKLHADWAFEKMGPSATSVWLERHFPKNHNAASQSLFMHFLFASNEVKGKYSFVTPIITTLANNYPADALLQLLLDYKHLRFLPLTHPLLL